MFERLQAELHRRVVVSPINAFSNTVLVIWYDRVCVFRFFCLRYEEGEMYTRQIYDHVLCGVGDAVPQKSRG